uniref:Retrotransposon gag domain-containing protein n=1 Tax=Fagus sylvatica TaxID=28930 RepID=A0A2N9J0Z0_FAGSY
MAEERVIPLEAPRMTMYQLLHPTQSSIPSCIMFPPNAPHVEIKQGLMAILPDFRGLENKNPYVHDKAKGWLYTLKPRSIGGWGEMTQEFYKKFFPPHKVQQVKRKISNFTQGNDETLFMAWEKFKDIYNYNFCPTHGYDTWSPLDSTDQNRSSTTISGGSVFRLREEDNMNAKISLLTKEIKALKLKGSRGVNTVYREDPMEKEQVCAFNQYRPNNSSYSNNYNPNMRNHPYLSYKSENVLNPTGPRNFDTSHTTSSSSRLPLEDVLYTFIQKQGEQNQKFDTMFTRIDEEMRETKSQVARLTEALSRTERGKLPSQTQPNPNNQTAKVVNTDKFEEVKSITILRSGKEIGKDAPKANEKSKETPAENDESGIAKSNDIEKCPFLTPFPQALKLPKNLDVTSEILEHLHQVKVSAIIQHKFPPKYKDPGCPTISCTIGDYNIERALLDLGASVNLLPFSVYLQLGLDELKPTPVTLQFWKKKQVIEAKNPPRSKKKSLLAYSDAPKLRLKKTPKGLPLASIEPHATSAVEVPSKESVDQEVEKAGEKTKFFEKHEEESTSRYKIVKEIAE